MKAIPEQKTPFFSNSIVLFIGQKRVGSMKMLSLLVSKLLTVMFVGSVTLWYIFTPYLVQPHERIVSDL